MRFFDILWLAFCNLRRTRMRSVLTIFGVVVGITSIMMLVSLGVGLAKITTSQLANMESLLTITVTSKSATATMEENNIDDQTIAAIERITGVKSVSPFLDQPGSVMVGETLSEAMIIGLSKEALSSEIGTLLAGKEFENDNGAVVSRSLSQAIGLEPEKMIGQDITLNLVKAEDLQASLSDGRSMSPQVIKTKITGVESGEQGNFVYAPLALVDLNPTAHSYSSLKVKVTGQKVVEPVCEEIKKIGLEATTVKTLIDQINKIFLIIEIVLGAFGAIGLLVACIGIINTMVISLIERIREIGIMKAIGASDTDVGRLFMMESALIGFFGGLVGITTALFFTYLFNEIFSAIMENAKQSPMPLFVSSWKFSLLMLGFAVIIALFAGIYPAFKARRTEPLKALYQR